MPHQLPAAAPGGSYHDLCERWQQVRALTEQLAGKLAAEDQVVQTMPDVSPTKWHLAHVTWFFEHFLLQPHVPGYRPYDERWHYLFNSYYYSVGQMHSRARRGLLSRPTVAQIRYYRAHVDAAMQPLLARAADEPELAFLITLGLNHEQQHQELLLTDIKHVLWNNPLAPAYDTSLPQPPPAAGAPQHFTEHAGGTAHIGADGGQFCFDNETPRHAVQLQAHALADRLVTNGEFQAFIAAGGYASPALWLADGWAQVQAEDWQRPLYWCADNEREYTLAGWQPLQPHAPVCHVSFYEADAYARWAGARLPLEAE